MAYTISDKKAPAEKELQRMENEGGVHPPQRKLKEVKVLLIDGAAPEAAGIREFLQQKTAPSFEVYYYDCPQKALGFLHKNNVDIILLDFGAVEEDSAEAVFHDIQTASRDTPVIIFTGQSEHDLALLIMREGAEDRVTREQFNMTPERLSDAIEFSLARRGVTAARAIVQDARETGAEVLKNAQAKGAAELKAAQEEGAAELKAAQEEGAAALEMMNQERLKDAHGHEQTLSWLSGGYSVEPLQGESHEDGNAWRFIAAELRLAQEQRARQLKETQQKEAAAKKTQEDKTARTLKEKQCNEIGKMG